MVQDCIFCKIVAGQIKAKVVYEDKTVLAFRDINPQAPVHIIVIPKEHFECLMSLGKNHLPLVADFLSAVQKIAQDENVVESGFRVVTNNGKDAGQSVHHLHFHVMGGRALGWPPG
jgi:histidine triad (HIT) family protein